MLLFACGPGQPSVGNATDYKLIAGSSGDRLRLQKHPDGAAIKLNRKAVRRIDCPLIQGRNPSVARHINPCSGRLSEFICQSEIPAIRCNVS